MGRGKKEGTKDAQKVLRNSESADQRGAREGVSQSLRRDVPGKGGKPQKGCPRKGTESIRRWVPGKGEKHHKGMPKAGGGSVRKGPGPRAIGQRDYT